MPPAARIVRRLPVLMSRQTRRTDVSPQAFAFCNALERIELPEGLTALGFSVFYGCKILKEVRLSESLVSIGECCFMYCRQLTDVNIPAGVTEFGRYIFSEPGYSLNYVPMEGITVTVTPGSPAQASRRRSGSASICSSVSPG